MRFYEAAEIPRGSYCRPGLNTKPKKSSRTPKEEPPACISNGDSPNQEHERREVNETYRLRRSKLSRFIGIEGWFPGIADKSFAGRKSGFAHAFRGNFREYDMEEQINYPSNDSITAFVLCGGLGTRLRPVISDRPKSMALVGGIPFLQLLIERLRCQGINNVVLGTGYMGEQIEGFFGRGDRLKTRIRYSREKEPLGTGGALKLAESQMSDPTLILNGDSYVDWSLPAMRDVYRAKDAAMVIAVHAVPDVTRYGSITLDCDGRVTQFIEKGIGGGPGLINAGVYLLRKNVVSDLPAGQRISLEQDVFPPLLNRRIYGLVCPGPFIDIGIPSDFSRAQTVLGVERNAQS